jgi:long-chain fatty acid transport protein
MSLRLIRRITFSLAAVAAAHVQASGPGFSGLFAKADNAETVFFNPAGMGLLEGNQMTLQGLVLNSFSSFHVNKAKTTVDGGNPRNQDPVLIPSFYYSHQYGENWKLGCSLNIPTGFGGNNGPNWAGRYHSDRFSLVYVALSPAVSYRVNEHLSLGLAARLMYSDSETHTRVNNDVFESGYPDGKLEADANGAGAGFSVSAIYAFSPDTRIGLVYNSQVNIDMDTTVDFHNVRRAPGIIEQLESQNISVASNVPAQAALGVYHRMNNGWELTWDLLWVEFSKFGAADVSLENDTVNAPDDLYNNFFMSSVGLSWPLDGRTKLGVGALWMEAPVSDDKRGFGIDLDEMWGVGVGVTRRLASGNDFVVNVNLLDTGSAPIDTGDSVERGRVVGKSKHPYSLALEFAYNWR